MRHAHARSSHVAPGGKRLRRGQLLQLSEGMVVADARTLKQSSLAHTVRDQGLRLRQLEQKQDAQLEELQAENLRLRSTVHDLAESLSALAPLNMVQPIEVTLLTSKLTGWLNAAAL